MWTVLTCLTCGDWRYFLSLSEIYRFRYCSSALVKNTSSTRHKGHLISFGIGAGVLYTLCTLVLHCSTCSWIACTCITQVFHALSTLSYNCRDARCYFFAVFCTVVFMKIPQKYCRIYENTVFFSISLLLHMCIAQWVKIQFFHPKYFFSALKISTANLFLQGWHPRNYMKVLLILQHSLYCSHSKYKPIFMPEKI